MLKRKNPDLPYNQTHNNHSPYRFQRKNVNLSPGLSPMRCRTPTRGNISPFRKNNNNDNHRGHSPIRFVSSKVANPVSQGFFRTQNISNGPSQFTQKYATCTGNNDHSMKRQSYYENDNNSRIKGPHQNSQRMMIHQNTKLFSKLVEKLNSQKKKQPQMVRRNTKPQIYKVSQIPYVQQKSIGIQRLTRQKSQTEQVNNQPINNQIQAVQSVVYQQKQSTKTYFQQQLNINGFNTYGKQNKTYHHEHSYKIKQYVVDKNDKNKEQIPLQIVKNNNKTIKVEKIQQKYTTLRNYNKEKSSTPTKTEQVSRQKVRSQKKQQQINRNQNNYENYNQTQTQMNQYRVEQNKKTNVYNLDDSSNFDDVRMLLDKLNDCGVGYEIRSKDDSINNNSGSGNMNMSFMNMDPFI